MTRTHHTIVSSPLGSNCYVIAAPAGRFIIDTGHPRAAAQTLSALEQQGHLESVAAVLHTHAHADHVGASALIHERTGAPVLALPAAPNHKLAAEERSLGLAAQPWPVERVLRDGEAIDTGDGLLRVVATPGHAADHCAFFLENRGLLFAGDLFCYNDVGTFDVTRHHAESLRLMLASVRRCDSLGAEAILPGHGPAITRPGQLLRQVEKRVRLFAEHPTILIAHTLMPLMLLLIDARRGMTVDELRDYAAGHAHFFEDFLDHVDAGTLAQELGKMLLILEMKGVIARQGERVMLRASAGLPVA